MTYYTSLGTTSAEIGGAIAAIIIRDIIINGLGLEGFPQIAVKKEKSDIFSLKLSFNDAAISFNISTEDAVGAAREMKHGQQCGNNIYNIVIDAVAALESKRKP